MQSHGSSSMIARKGGARKKVCAASAFALAGFLAFKSAGGATNFDVVGKACVRGCAECTDSGACTKPENGFELPDGADEAWPVCGYGEYRTGRYTGCEACEQGCAKCDRTGVLCSKA